MQFKKYTRSLWAIVPVLAIMGALAAGLAAPGPRTTVAAATKPAPGMETATLAAGCFWSMEAIFKQLKGVQSVEPGYAGGRSANPSYEQVETGTTGYAETVNIIFDPKVISYRDLLDVLLIARNPTTRNQQGPDSGPQYRSVIFTHNAAQAQAAREMIAQVNASHTWNAPIVTEVVPFTTFSRAENYHLNYYNLHPNESYCQYVIAPEIAEFRAKFHSKLKS